MHGNRARRAKRYLRSPHQAPSHARGRSPKPAAPTPRNRATARVSSFPDRRAPALVTGHWKRCGNNGAASRRRLLAGRPRSAGFYCPRTCPISGADQRGQAERTSAERSKPRSSRIDGGRVVELRRARAGRRGRHDVDAPRAGPGGGRRRGRERSGRPQPACRVMARIMSARECHLMLDTGGAGLALGRCGRAAPCTSDAKAGSASTGRAAPASKRMRSLRTSHARRTVANRPVNHASDAGCRHPLVFSRTADRYV